MSTGIIITKKGVSVKTKDPRNWNFNSSYPTLKLKSVITGTLDGSGSASFSHGLTYIPLIMGWFDVGDGNYYQQSPNPNLGSLSCGADKSNVYIGGVPNGGYMIFVFYDQL